MSRFLDILAFQVVDFVVSRCNLEPLHFFNLGGYRVAIMCVVLHAVRLRKLSPSVVRFSRDPFNVFDVVE